MSANKNNDKNMRYPEIYNLNNLKYWSVAPIEEWETTFNNIAPPNKMSNHDWLKWIKREVTNLAHNGTINRQVEYKYSKNAKAGRIYPKGFGLQNISKQMRPHFYGKKVYEIDISNCFPTLLYYLFSNSKDSKKHPIPLLKDYLINREEKHKLWGIDKKTFNSALNKDAPFDKGNYHDDFKATIYQTLRRKIQFCESNSKAINILLKKKGKNPMASTIFHLLEREEEKIRNFIINQLENEYTILVPMHDGILTDYPVTDNFIATLNSRIADEFTKPLLKVSGVDDYSFALVQQPEVNWSEANSFTNISEKFWSDKGIITNITGNGTLGYFWINSGKFCTYTLQEMKQLACDPGYDIDWEPKDFKKLFSCDASRNRTFEQSVWHPYNNLDSDPTGDEVYNRYVPDTCKILEHPCPVSIKLFKKLCKAVTHDEWTMHQLIGKIAYSFTNPDKLDQTLFVLKGNEGGIGKDTLMKWISAIIGDPTTSRDVDIEDFYGAGSENAVGQYRLIWFNELEGRDGNKYLNKIKKTVTEDYLVQKRKFCPNLQVKNVSRKYILSNATDPIPPDRRICICQARTLGEDLLSPDEFKLIYQSFHIREKLDSVYTYLMEYKTPLQIVEKYREVGTPDAFPFDGTFNYKNSPSKMQKMNQQKSMFDMDHMFCDMITNPKTWKNEDNCRLDVGEHKGVFEGDKLIIKKTGLSVVLKDFVESWSDDIDEVDSCRLMSMSVCHKQVRKWLTEYYQVVKDNGQFFIGEKRVNRCLSIDLEKLKEIYKRQGKL